MGGYRFLVCCVLMLTIYKPGEAFVNYKFTPFNWSNSTEAEPQLPIKCDLFPINDFNEDSAIVTFTVKLLDSAILPSEFKISTTVYKVVAAPASSSVSGNGIVALMPNEETVYYHGSFNWSVPTQTKAQMGNLSAELSCNNPIFCSRLEKRVIVKETRILTVTATATIVGFEEASVTANVTVTLSKDLATTADLTLSVSLVQDKSPEYSKDVVLSNATRSSNTTVLRNVTWGDYQLTISCGKKDSVCSALKTLIQFPTPVSVLAHPPAPELIKIISKFSTTCTLTASSSDDASTTASNTTSTTTAGSTTASTTAAGSSYLSTHSMEFAVGGLIVALVCALLGYLAYHYRATVREWICSKKAVVSNLPKTLRRARGANKYTKLPRTMQEALHQD